MDEKLRNLKGELEHILNAVFVLAAASTGLARNDRVVVERGEGDAAGWVLRCQNLRVGAGNLPCHCTAEHEFISVIHILLQSQTLHEQVKLTERLGFATPIRSPKYG